MAKQKTDSSNPLAQRIDARIAELKTNRSAVSSKAGLSRDFIRKLGVRGPNSTITAANLRKLAKALDLPEDDLLKMVPSAQVGHGPSNNSPPSTSRSFRVAPDLQMVAAGMAADVPVYGTAAGGKEGAFRLSQGAVDMVRRPPALLNARDIYAIFIEGDSMVPEHRPGDLRFVHPHRPPAIGDTVVVEIQDGENSERVGFIKHLVQRSASKLVLAQLNPAITIEIDRKTVLSIHKVLTQAELFGV